MREWTPCSKCHVLVPRSLRGGQGCTDVRVPRRGAGLGGAEVGVTGSARLGAGAGGASGDWESGVARVESKQVGRAR